jgi:hypothetical protein
MALDACDWRYLCEPVPAPVVACVDKPLPATTAPPPALIGTWLLDSFDVLSDDAAVTARHVEVAREHPILAVTFAADGTWRAASCGSAENYEICSASCEVTPTCTTGTYAYDNGKLSSTLTDHAFVDVATTDTGFVLTHFFTDSERSNFVKIDALPPCQ